MGQHREGYDCLRVYRTWLYNLKRYGWHLLFYQGLEELKHLAFFAESLPAELWTLLNDFSNYAPHAGLFHVMKVMFTSVCAWKTIVSMVYSKELNQASVSLGPHTVPFAEILIPRCEGISLVMIGKWGSCCHLTMWIIWNNASLL